MTDVILTLNCGSSSIKFSLFEANLREIGRGRIEDIGQAPHFSFFDAHLKCVSEKQWPEGTYEALLGGLLAWIEGSLGHNNLAAVGHRIVHGGSRYVWPVRLDAAAMEDLAALSPLAPLHQPHNLAAARTVAAQKPGLLQVGCFDTAFHNSMDATVRRFGLPRSLEEAGVRRYGFHGLSYEYIAGQLREIAPAEAGGRVIVAHLGNGASLCAMRDGHSVDTTMGMTALDGLVMATRPGALDPGVLLYLMRKGMGPDEMEELLYCRSGLLGVTGTSGDMRRLLEGREPHAQEAVDLFVFRIAREIGALTATLGGLDGLVFTGGIGENAPVIRSRVCESSVWLGISLDGPANNGNARLISSAASRLPVRVLPTDEEIMIARHTSAMLA